MGFEFPQMEKPVVSPDGRFHVRQVAEEMRMSHWLFLPMIEDLVTGKVVLDLTGSVWSAEEVKWSEDGRTVTLGLRRYPGNTPGVDVVIDPSEGTALVHMQDGVRQTTVEKLLDWLEEYHVK